MIGVSLPGVGWLKGLKNTALRIGVLTGLYLTAIMAAALIVANRISAFDSMADVRNWTFRFLFAVVMLVPILSFLRAPWSLFTSGLTAWLVFSLSYMGATHIFSLLERRFFPPFQMFMLGAMLYSTVAVAGWVVHLISAMRSHAAPAGHARIFRKAG